MRHGFLSYAPLVFWVYLLGALLVRVLRRRRYERLASIWPSVPGKIRNGCVTGAGGRLRLVLTYDAFEAGHGIETYEREFLPKPEAEHAVRVLSGMPCVVHYNPQRADETTLLWSDVSALLARDPYVPQIMPLGRVGYRWLVGLAAAAVAGLTASVVLLGIGMSVASSCVCEAITALLLISPIMMSLSLVPMSRMMAGAPRAGILNRIKFVLPGWRWSVVLATLLGTVVSFFHYAPMFRALPMNAEIPDRVFLGTTGAPLVAIYVFAVLITLEALRRLQPVGDRVRVPTVV